MALGSGTSFQNPFDEKEKKKKKQNQGPSVGSTRNHPTRKGIKQRYTSKGWTNIREGGGDEKTPPTKTKRYRGGSPSSRAAQKKLRQEKELARLKGGGKVGLLGVDVLNRTPGRIRQLEKQLGKNNKKDENKNENKDEGGKVTYKHRNTGGDTGIRVSGDTVVSRGKNDAIRNNAKTKESGNQGTTETAKSNEKQETEKKSTPTNVFTKHYKTGKELGVMTRAQRRAYEKEAGNRTWESEKKRLGATGNKQNTKASSKSWRRKQELRLAKQNKKKKEDETGSIFVRSKIA